MSQDQIQLPEPAATVSKGPVAFFCKFTETGKELRGKFDLYTAETVRRLIAEAVAAEREACIAALDDLNGWSYDDPASSAIAAIRSRGDQT